MMEDIEKQSCGNCGGSQFAVYTRKKKDTIVDGIRRWLPTIFVVECLDCKSTTIIQPKPAELETAWGEKSEGVLCKL